MAEISYFWDGFTVGDAVVSPYDAATIFASVMSTLSRGKGYPQQGYVVDSANAGNRLAPVLVGGSGPATVTVDTGTAVVDGTWYNNSVIKSFLIPDMPPSSSTRLDRIVLRKNWINQTVRLIYSEGAPSIGGGVVPPFAATPGNAWDIPICKLSITTGSVVTLTDERPLSAAGRLGGSLFVPSNPANMPQTHYNADPGIGVYMAVNGLPTDATAAYVTFLKNTGTFNLFGILGSLTLGQDVYTITGNPPELKPPAILVPIDTLNHPGQIGLANSGGVIDVFFFLVGYYIPF